MYLEFTSSKLTERVKSLALKSHTASDEIFLSKLATAFMDGKVVLRYKDKNGEERIVTYDGDVKEL